MKVLKGLYILALVLFQNQNHELKPKEYVRQYYSNGILKSEGWIEGNHKINYWIFYHPNGNLMKMGHFNNSIKEGYWHFYSENGLLEKEGHFINGCMDSWWLFYDELGNINHKCQLKNGIKDGYCLLYKKKKIISAEKYEAGKKMQEWFDFKSFKNENDLSNLR